MNAAIPAPHTAMDLLHTACQMLQDDLLPLLPAAQKHAALMVQNALGIAGRELEMGSQLLEIERTTLGRLVAFEAASDQPSDTLVLGLRRRLVMAIRRGEFDLEEEELLQTMKKLTRARCSIDAPKLLA